MHNIANFTKHKISSSVPSGSDKRKEMRSESATCSVAQQNSSDLWSVPGSHLDIQNRRGMLVSSHWRNFTVGGVAPLDERVTEFAPCIRRH